jgi:signal transduction histidine kinase
MTTRENDTLHEQYAAALRRYLLEPTEDARSAAYDLGHRALAQGVGVLDLVTLYSELLPMAQRAGSQHELARAAEFLAESLAPYEMALRGYADANRVLRTQNFELQRTKAAMEAAHEELESFSYSVAHDLRAPLRRIDSLSELLAEPAAALDPAGRGYIDSIRGSIDRMSRLIDDLLQLARLARAPLRTQTVDLSALARQVIDDLSGASRGRRVTVTIEDRLQAWGDPPLLRVVLDNLIGNAWKFTSKVADARIEVGQEPGGSQTVFFVRDNGAGFDPAFAEKLFTPFQRLHLADEFPGTGIGLATVRRIVRRHGGRVWAEAAVGAGATFFWTLAQAPTPDGRQLAHD